MKQFFLFPSLSVMNRLAKGVKRYLSLMQRLRKFSLCFKNSTSELRALSFSLDKIIQPVTDVSITLSRVERHARWFAAPQIGKLNKQH